MNAPRPDLLPFDDYRVHVGGARVRVSNLADAVELAKHGARANCARRVRISRHRGKEVVAQAHALNPQMVEVRWNRSADDRLLGALFWAVTLSGLAFSVLIVSRLA